MAGAGKLPFVVIAITLFILHFVSVSSERDCGRHEYSTECEETNATLWPAGDAKLAQKETELAMTRDQLAQSRTKLAQKESELAKLSAKLALMQDQLAQSRVKLAQKESEMAEKLAECTKNHTDPEETSPKPPIAEADAQRLSAEFNSSQIHIRSMLTELAENNATLLLESMGINSRVFSTALLSIMNMTTSPATVRTPKIYGTLNHTAKFSCESDGRPLSLCLWSRTVRDQQEVIWMNRHGHNVSSDGIQLPSPFDLGGGKCSVSIEAVMEDHFGTWTCILLAVADGEILTGEKELRDAPQTSIFLPKFKDGIWRFSVKTSQVTRMWNSDEYILGIAFDAARNVTYWNSWNTIYRGTINHTETETLLNRTDVNIGSFNGLAYDWIADNLYVATDSAVLACNNDKPFRCATLLRHRGPTYGIALDPNEGTMYITTYTGNVDKHCILKAGTDGSSPTGIVAGARAAHGIQIDFQSRRLYWAEWYESRIRSSNLDGGDVMTVNKNSRPFGISLVGSRIFWSEHLPGELQSMETSGSEVRTETSGMFITAHIVTLDWSLPKNRPNPCARQDCSGICVLSRTSFKCLK